MRRQPEKSRLVAGLLLRQAADQRTARFSANDPGRDEDQQFGLVVDPLPVLEQEADVGQVTEERDALVLLRISCV
jgi:hypothetical protein